MKTHLGIVTLLLSAASATLAAPISLTGVGTQHYLQDFNVLATATNNGTSTTTWLNDSTIAGWWLDRAGNGATVPGLTPAPGYTYRVGDGTAAPTVGEFYSMGPAADGNRALGSPSTTSMGELAAIAVFRNNAVKAVDLTNIQYRARVLRTNGTLGNVESIFVWSKKASNVADLTSNLTTAAATTAVFPAANSTAPTSNYISGWNRHSEAEYIYISPSAATQVNENTLVSALLASTVRVFPGEFFAVRWGNINDGAVDALMGIDDVDLTFTEVNSSIAPVVSNMVRNVNGTPRDPSNDTINFTLTVAGLGAVGPNWMITDPPFLAGSTGTYGAATAFNNIPIANFAAGNHTVDLTVTDQGGAGGSTTIQVAAPWASLVGAVTSVVYNDNATPADASDDLVSYAISADSLYTGTDYTVTPPGVTHPYGTTEPIVNVPAGSSATYNFVDSADATVTLAQPVVAPAIIGTNSVSGTPVNWRSQVELSASTWVFDGTAKTIRMQNGGGAPPRVVASDVVNLTGVNGVVKFSATLEVQDTSSGFEVLDTFYAELRLSDGVNNTVVNLIAPHDTTVPPDGLLVGAELAPGGGTVAVPTIRTYALAHFIPDNITSAQFVFRGNNDSANEIMIVRDILIEVAPPSILASASNIVRNENLPGPADDSLSFTLTITGANGGTGWTSPTPGLSPASGGFGAIPVTLAGPLPVGSVNVVLVDNTLPAVTTNVAVSVPVRYVIGQVDVGGPIRDLGSVFAVVPPVEWINDAPTRTLTMSNGGTPDKVVESELINLTAVGAVSFSATFRANDTSNGTNFEQPDKFRAELVYEVAGVPTTISLVQPYDIGDGANSTVGAGTNGVPDGYMNGYSGTAGTDQVTLINYANAADEYAANATRDEFNPGGLTVTPSIDNTFPLTASIPANADNVRLRVLGQGVGGGTPTEFFILSNVLFYIDSDGDGMSDAYEDANGLNKNNPADKLTDLDNDGQNNYSEYLAGTAANSAASVLKMVAASVVGTQGTATWTSVPGKVYRIDISQDLQIWTDAGVDVPAAANPATQTSVNIDLTPVIGFPSSFLRVRVKN